MLFIDNQFETNKIMKVCFYVLLCCTICLFVSTVYVIIIFITDKELPWWVSVLFGLLLFALLCLFLVCMLAMRFKKLEIDKEKIIKTTILNQKKIYFYQPSRLRIIVSPTYALNRGLKLTFFLDEKKIFAYDLVESVATSENFIARRKKWAEGLNKIGCLIVDPAHCLE